MDCHLGIKKEKSRQNSLFVSKKTNVFVVVVFSSALRSQTHTWRNCFNLFQISFSANTTDAPPGVSGESKDQKFCEKFKNAHCQVDHPVKIE